MDTGLVTAFSDAMGDLQTFLTGTVALALFGLVLVGVGINFAVKYFKKAAAKS